MKYPIQAMVLSLVCALSFPVMAHGAVGKYDYIDQNYLHKSFKEHCKSNLDEFKNALRKKNVKINNTIISAANSEILNCNHEGDPSYSLIQNSDYLAQTDEFIKKNGVKAYVSAAKEEINSTLKQYRFDESVQSVIKNGATEEELMIIMMLIKSKSTSEAFISSAAKSSPEVVEHISGDSEKGTSAEAL